MLSLPVVEETELPTDLYHYTDAGGLLGILDKKALWATHAAYLNDSEEIVFGVQQVLEQLTDLNKNTPDEVNEGWDPKLPKWMVWIGIRASIGALKSAVKQRTNLLQQSLGPFVTCLSEAGDQLSQWRGYGGGGGYAIRFNAEQLRESIRKQSEHLELPLPGLASGQIPLGARRFVKMEYDPTAQVEFLRKQLIGFIKEVAKYLTTEKQDSEYMKQKGAEVAENTMGWLLGVIIRMKNPGFIEEKEHRILTFSPPEFYTPNDHGLVPRLNIHFHPSCVKEIMVGPGRNVEMRESSLRYYLQNHPADYPDVKVTVSKTPFRGD